MNKGFTLVELLAVVVILSIIATIVTVSVNLTIKNSKNSLSKTQQNNIEKAAEAYYLKEGMSEDVNCVNVSDLISKGYIDSKQVIDPKNKEPMNGSVKIIYESNQYSYEYSEDKCKFIVAATESNKTLAGTVPQGNFDLGDEYIVNVDGTHEYHFYVLSTEGNKVSLILNRNICANGEFATSENICRIPWVSKEDYNDDTNYSLFGNTNKGPITAMNIIHNVTKNWKNVKNIQLNYIDEGGYYGGISIDGNTTSITMKDGTQTASYENLKARMPKLSELEGAGCTNQSGSCKTYIVNGLDSYTNKYPVGTKEDISGIFGYWSLASFNEQSDSAAFVNIRGEIVFDYLQYDEEMETGDSGVRPVIEVLKSDLQ